MRGLRRRVPLLMLLALLYQWGACPCGCLEHNVWLQLAGLSDHAHHPTGHDSSRPTFESADEHDCTGMPRPLFLTEAERQSVVGWPTRGLAKMTVVDSPSLEAFAKAGQTSYRGPPEPLGSSVCRAQTQVFRL